MRTCCVRSSSASRSTCIASRRRRSWNIAELSGLSLRDTIARLMDAGLDSIPGAGAEILDDEVRRRISRLKCSTQEWIDVHLTAHSLGMRTTANDDVRLRRERLSSASTTSKRSGGFRNRRAVSTAFIPWSFQHENTPLGRSVKEEATATEYLKTLANLPAVSRKRSQCAVFVGDAGIEDLPDRAALRRQRRGQHHDRRERRRRRGYAPHGQ